MRNLVFAGLLFLSLGACKSTPDPVVPPTNAAASASPQLEGVYYSQGEAGVDLLRFTSAGKVFSISTPSQQTLEPAVRLLMKESDRCASGPFAIKDGILRFTLTSKQGAVEYAGAIKEDKLNARWRSAINGASIETTYTFVKVIDESQEAPEKPAATADEPTPAAPSGPVAPELTLIPDGAAWYCYKTSGASRCERKPAACESSRKTASALHKDLKSAKCAKQPSAYCYTATSKGGARGAASCAATEADCKAEAASLEDSDAVVSTCSKQ